MQYFDKLGLMIDCSRNGVATKSTVKKLIDLSSAMGYNFIQLYTEDTLELKKYPYAGHMRGRYTKEEIQELDEYALSKGIELMPCIQTLGHLTQLFKWEQYYYMQDCTGVLLADLPETYEYLDHVFATCAECFTSRNINIGMDEAYFAGLGAHLRKYGYEDQFTILCRHLKKVSEIADKYGFKPMMWSDLFFNFLRNENFSGEIQMTDELRSAIPENVSLVYWEYYIKNLEEFDKGMRNHQLFDREVYYAAQALTCTGFAPANRFTLDVTEKGLRTCIKNGVRNAMLTLWGDDGKECSYFSALPSIYAFSEYAKGNFDRERIKIGFEKLIGIPFDGFMLLDLPNEVDENQVVGWNNPGKYIFYNDLFIGIYDCYAIESSADKFEQDAKKLQKYCSHSEYGYLFKEMQALLRVLAVKVMLGVKTRQYYKENNLTALRGLAEKEYRSLIQRTDCFYELVKAVWDIENKPFGFEPMDYRFGGIVRRVEHLRKRLLEYVDGNVDSIPELEEKCLDRLGGMENYTKEQTMTCVWQRIITTSNL